MKFSPVSGENHIRLWSILPNVSAGKGHPWPQSTDGACRFPKMTGLSRIITIRWIEQIEFTQERGQRDSTLYHIHLDVLNQVGGVPT